MTAPEIKNAFGAADEATADGAVFTGPLAA
jgi:hypothetical protein